MIHIDVDYLAVRLETALETITDIKTELSHLKEENTVRMAIKK